MQKKTAKPEPLKHVNRTNCAERVIESAKLDAATVIVWREILQGFVTYTRGYPVPDLVKRFEGYTRHPRPDDYVKFLQQLSATHPAGLDGWVQDGLESLAREGLVRLGTDKRKRFDLRLNDYVYDELPWLWPLPVEAWPEPLFLAALALRVDQGDNPAHASPPAA
jgi:hypothetical protein